MKNQNRKFVNEAQTIDHIKFIAKDLFKQMPTKKQIQDSKKIQKDVKHLIKSFVKSPSKNHKQQNSHSHQFRYKTHKSKSKKKSIFQNFDDFWQKCQSPQKTTYTPLIDRINKSIYNEFRKQSNRTKQSRNIRNQYDRQQIWSDFLKRDQQWRKQKNNNLRQSQMKQMANHNLVKSRIKTISNFDHNKIYSQIEMSEVEKSIKKLRLQTQKLRLKVLNIDSGQRKHSKTKLIKTYQQK